MKNPYQKYKETSIQSAGREKLLLMLYEGAIRFNKKAMAACEQGDLAERGINIGKTYDIIMELNNTLNHDVGGEISKNLEQLYMFMSGQLTKANITGNIEHLQSVGKILETLHSGWVEAIEKLKKQETAKP